MTKQSRRKYEASFKKEAVRMADQSKEPDSRIEIDLGIFRGAIRRWRKELQQDPQNARFRVCTTDSNP
jgi:transposase-like protein